MPFLLPIKQLITWSLFENDTMWRFWKGNSILRVQMYLLRWRRTNFFCIISILLPKLINVNCLHFIGCQNNTNVLKIAFYIKSSHCSTTILSKHITSNTWQFNSAKNIFAFSCPPQLRRRAKLFVSCCRPYLVHQYTVLPFSNLHLPGEIFTCKGVKS